MSISSVLKFRMENDRKAAIALNRAVAGVEQNNRSVLGDIHSGLERASWYGSCFFDSYADVCAQLKTEDKRFLKNIFEIYKRKDIIADIIRIYLEEELKFISNNQIGSLNAALAKSLSNYYGGMSTKVSMANALSIIVVNSFNFKSEVMAQINKYALLVVTLASLYGKIQAAAMTARNLKTLSPILYVTLYNNNMEMLYFLVSEKINKALIKSMGLHGEERIVSIMKSLVY